MGVFDVAQGRDQWRAVVNSSECSGSINFW
jgi:hypothetical protein